MSATDPHRVMWDAFEAHGCNPRGPLNQFTITCPAHEDGTPSVSVGTGHDGQVLLWCFAGCPAEDIVAAVGKTMGDLYPQGHRNARPMRGVARPVPMLDLILSSLKQLGIDYRASLTPTALWVAEACPVCQRADRFPLWITEEGDDSDSGGYRRNRRINVTCTGGCQQVDVLNALAVIA
jgi:hypothetical protein